MGFTVLFVVCLLFAAMDGSGQSKLHVREDILWPELLLQQIGASIIVETGHHSHGPSLKRDPSPCPDLDPVGELHGQSWPWKPTGKLEEASSK